MSLVHFVIASPIPQLGVLHPTSFYKKLSPEDAKRLASWKTTSKQQMWEFSGQEQGDMVLTPTQRNGATNIRYRWNNREIPYELSPDFTEQQQLYIRNALEAEFSKTCINVRPKTENDIDYVYVSGNNTGCWARVGRVGGRQAINLQRRGCLYRGAIVHEFLHALGFEHQQSASERDDYVDILWENIREGTTRNFRKFGPEKVTSFGEKYDYGSIMHYGKYAFSSNGQPTILPKNPNATIGQNRGLSTTDIIKLNKMYNCI